MFCRCKIHIVKFCFAIAILDEDADDTLINVNIIDEERAAKNVENKKKKPDYQPYDQDEFDTDGMVSSCLWKFCKGLFC